MLDAATRADEQAEQMRQDYYDNICFSVPVDDPGVFTLTPVDEAVDVVHDYDMKTNVDCDSDTFDDEDDEVEVDDDSDEEFFTLK